MLFGKDFKVIKDFKPIFLKIGKFEEFYAHIVDGKLEYEILDSLFGQPSPSNWDEGEYSQKRREKASRILQYLLDNRYIELM